MKKILTYTLVLSLTLITLNACSTISGIGKDIQRAAGQSAQSQN
jgi:predicted small secreted protein